MAFDRTWSVGRTQIALDARGTARVTASTDRAEAQLTGGTVQVIQHTPGELIWYAADFDHPGGIYVQPTNQVPGLDLNVYAAPWSSLSTRQRTAWTFTSAHLDQAAALPLLAVRYDLGLDNFNRAPAGAPFTFEVSVEQSGPEQLSSSSR